MRPLFAFAIALSLVSAASAQTRHRRPYAESYRLNYGFDNNYGSSGCSDYACAGACYDGHTGSDFGAPFGTTVLASADGRVVATNDGCPNYGSYGDTCGGRCGNYVQLEHADGSRTIYCHMRSGSLLVRTGDRVSCGQAIGSSASSGSSTGPHLHFGYRPAGGSSQESFAGSCGRRTTIWVSQGAYREPPSTSCECVASTEVCNGRDDDCDGSADEDEVCEVQLLVEEPGAYSPPSTTDVNGDRRADVCARGSIGIWCWLARDGGWDGPTEPVPFSDANGWADVTNYATLRMGDVDGDGRADVCARANNAVYCATSTGSGFGAPAIWRDGISDENGWDAPRYYTTIRLADVNGDGREDLCARDSQGFGCWLSDGTRFDRRVEGPRWSNDGGWGAARYYGTIRMGDVNGDRRADVCARSAAGIECWLASGDGFPTRIDGPAWSDASGWGAQQYWSTLRLADVNGDGKRDVCARNSFDLRCVLANADGTGFDETVTVAALSDASGWADLSNYATLRVGDIDGNGSDDLCLRANAGMYCWAWDGSAFVQRTGPAWSDDSGWNNAHYYGTVQLADIDADGLSDLCARAAAGWRCVPSRGDSFGDALEVGDMHDGGGWSAPQYWTTIMTGSRTCRAEMEACNGRDDDCDGEVDEHAVDEICNGTDDDCDGEVDEHASAEVCNGADDDCDGEVDEGLSCGVGDGGVPGADGGAPSTGPRDGSLTAGCACRASARGDSGSPFALLALGLFALRARRRRARSIARME